MFATQQRGNQAGAMARASHEDQVESEETSVVGVPVTTGSASGVGGGGGRSQRRWERRRRRRISQCEVLIIILVGYLHFFIMKMFEHTKRSIT